MGLYKEYFQPVLMNSPPETNPCFEELLQYLKRTHNFDYTGYKRPSLMRGVHYRMNMIPIESYSNYTNYLEEHPEEFLHLFNTIEINLTTFFRNASAWDYIAANVIPRIIASKSSDEPIRAWSAGCATGEEVYSMAILLAEALGVEQFCSRVHIFATDIDYDAINQARQGSYRTNQVTGIPDHLLKKYFVQTDDYYVFRKDLRRCISFSRHNLIEDAPMSKIDLLACRNTLIYFNTEAQTRVLVRFHFGLRDNGFLFLGNTEIIPSEITSLFSGVNFANRIFTKIANVNLHPSLLVKVLKRGSHRTSNY